MPTSSQPRDPRTVRRRIELGSMLFAIVSFAYWFSMILAEPKNAFRIDALVYRGGVQAMLSGRPLYEPVFAQLYFVYPPFAALVFSPMALFNDNALAVLMITINMLLVMLVVALIARETEASTRVVTRGAAACLGIGYTFLLVPLADTMWLGQINIILMALVVGDMVALARGRRWAGVLIGIAAGIKLTPLLLVAMLLVGRRWRASANAMGTFAATVLIGFLALPHDAWTYWTSAMLDTRRIAPSTWIVNQSLSGVLARLAPDAPRLVWLVGASIVALIALATAAKLMSQGRFILAAAVVGVASAIAAPFSWEHHWIWLVVFAWWPLCAAALGFVERRRSWPWLFVAALAATAVSARYPGPEGNGIGIFAFGGEHSWWTAAYPIAGFAMILVTTIVAFWPRQASNDSEGDGAV